MRYPENFNLPPTRFDFDPIFSDDLVWYCEDYIPDSNSPHPSGYSVDFYDSSMYREPFISTKPLNPEAKEWVPKNYKMSHSDLDNSDDKLSNTSLEVVKNQKNLSFDKNIENSEITKSEIILMSSVTDLPDLEEVDSSYFSVAEELDELKVLEDIVKCSSSTPKKDSGKARLNNDSLSDVEYFIEYYTCSDDSEELDEMNEGESFSDTESVVEFSKFDEGSSIEFAASSCSAAGLEDVLEHDSTFESENDSFDVKFADSEDEKSPGPSLRKRPSVSACVLPKNSSLISFFVCGSDSDESDSGSDSDDECEEEESCCDIDLDDDWDMFGGLIACKLTSKPVNNATSVNCDQVDSINDPILEENLKTQLEILNEKWNREISKDIVDSTPSKISFHDKPEIHTMYTWAFARQKARKGEWECFARDRARFLNRINAAEPIISKVLDPVHRQNVYSKLYPNNR